MNKWKLYGSALLLVLLVGLSWWLVSRPHNPPTADQATPPAAVAADTAAAVVAAPVVSLPDTADMSKQELRLSVVKTDTVLRIEGRLYHLRMRAIADSTQMLSAVTGGIVGEAYAADDDFASTKKVRGPEGHYSITLTDSAGRQVFRREFRKADFYRLVGPDIAVVAEPEPAVFLGYYPELGGLAFWQSIGIPQSDVGDYLFLLLDLRGQVLELSLSNSWGSGRVDCSPAPAPNGQALLTCATLLRPGRPPLSLEKPKANLMLARFLNDSTLLTLYAYGETHYEYEADSTVKSMDFVEPSQMRRVPNAFLTTVRGSKVASFRYNGAWDLLGYFVPRTYVHSLHTYYLLDENRGLRLIDKHDPAATREVGFQQMTRFTPPQQPREVRFRVQSEMAAFDFFADQDNPERLRYRKSSNE